MRGDVGALTVSRPKGLGDALALLDEDPRPHPIAGGTDLYVAINDGNPPSGWYLDLLPLSRDLRFLTIDAASIRIGALTTYTDLLRSRAIARIAPVLAAMARDVGAVAIQNRGTLGGSLGNASPASDPAPVLLALDASVTLASAKGVRALPLSEFFTGYRKTAARPGELIHSLTIPRTSLDGWRIAYRKVGTRRAQAISKVVLATAVKAGSAAAVAGVRIAFGSVAATTVRARAAEAAILGTVLDAAGIAGAQRALAQDIAPIDDVRSTAQYRMQVARNLLAAQLSAAAAAR